MTWEDAKDVVIEWQRAHKKENLYDETSLRLTYVGTEAAHVVERYAIEHVTRAMAQVELYERFVRFGAVLKYLLGSPTGDGGAGVRLWQNGDVLEYQGDVGIISRDDSCDYVELVIPIESMGGFYRTNGDSVAGRATKLSRGEADDWVKKWYSIKEAANDRSVFTGLDYAMERILAKELADVPF